MPPAPATCLHGLPEGECLICRTLSAGPAAGPVGAWPEPRSLRGPSRPSASTPTRARRPAPARDEASASPRRHGVVLAGAVAAVVAVVALAAGAWVVVGLAYAALHIIELVVVAVVAGWTGYRIGRYRGRRER